MKIAVYKSRIYYIISVLGETIELAPTQHGAGSFYTHQDFVKFIGEWSASKEVSVDDILSSTLV